MKKLQALGKSLSRQQQKDIIGGYVDPGGGGNGNCTGCRCVDNGYHSCWYSNGGYGVCQRVYPNCQSLEINLSGCYSGDTCITN